MKKIYFILTCVLFAKAALAQKEQLTMDERDKYIYYQVADMPGLTADTLYNRSLSGLTKYYNGTGFKPAGTAGTSITISPVLVIYSNKSIAKHEDGELAYTLHLEFKNEKYRYWLTDFVFKPYQRNRYSEFEKIPGVEIPMEKVKAKLDGKTFDNYQEQIISFGKQLGENMKIYMANTQKKEAAPAKVDIKKW